MRKVSSFEALEYLRNGISARWIRCTRLMGLAGSLTLILFSLAGPVRARNSNGGGGKNSSSIPVTSILNNTGSFADDTNFRVQSDTVSSYYYNGVDSVSSILQGGSGDWVLDTTTSMARGALIDLRAPDGTTNPPFTGYQYLPTRIIVQCSLALSGSFAAMSLNTQYSCPASVAFTYSGNNYVLKMEANSLAPETNAVLVTCTATSSGKCTDWTLNPITQPAGSVESIARLEQVTKSKNVNLGDFYISFLFNITNP